MVFILWCIFYNCIRVTFYICDIFITGINSLSSNYCFLKYLTDAFFQSIGQLLDLFIPVSQKTTIIK